jgi:hypothetical protein
LLLEAPHLHNATPRIVKSGSPSEFLRFSTTLSSISLGDSQVHQEKVRSLAFLLFEYVQKVGLDIDKFKKEMSGHIYSPLINKSLKMESIGVLKVHQLSLLMEYVMKTRGI